ncbi:hypothetical protein NHH03_02130 [Stieleria sp. TO1_6]|uniref:hypothetical protein n=1 Tax=Stieleria tagensis TaxID=2956795 RepID=UPI00209B4C83|nr:hypothetical protein [Stieleria tagensis]MCO8120520.1 hypothetical protein [Stieleria tagensis]
MNHLFRLTVLLGILIGTAGPTRSIAEDLGGASVVVRLSENFVRDQFKRDIVKRHDVDTVILGTRAIGHAKTTATMDASLSPCASGIQVRICVKGQTIASTESNKGPVVFNSVATTDFHATTELIADETGIRFTPIEVSGTTNSETKSIRSKRLLMRNIVRRIASRKIDELRPRAEQIGHRQAMDQIAATLKKELDTEIQKAQVAFAAQRILTPQIVLQLGPDTQIQTTDDSLVVSIHSSNLEPVGHPTTEIRRGGTVSIRKSLLDNIAIAPANPNLFEFVNQPISLISDPFVSTDLWSLQPPEKTQQRSSADPDHWVTFDLDPSMFTSGASRLADNASDHP